MLAASHSLFMGASGLVLGVKMKRMFHRPYFATSIRDWWSRRWNQCFKDQFYRIVFRLLVDVNNNHRNGQRKGNQSGPKSSNNRNDDTRNDDNNNNDDEKAKPPLRRSTLAALMTFLVSGVIHDYYAYVTFGREFTVESTAFFTIHGALTALQVFAQSRVPWLRPGHHHRRHGVALRPLAIALTTVLILVTMPLFQGPYLRGEFYLPKHLPIPYFIEHGKYASWVFAS